MNYISFSELLNQSASLHDHLCPRQVIGVRMGMYAGDLLSLDLPQKEKRLLTIAETDGCAVDGISVATNCWVGRRTLRIEDYGKVAATFIDTEKDQAVRIVPRNEARSWAFDYVEEEGSGWETQLAGYQQMPADKLFRVQTVRLKILVEKIISHPGCKTICEICGEEIINEREIFQSGKVYCRACLGDAYYLENQRR